MRLFTRVKAAYHMLRAQPEVAAPSPLEAFDIWPSCYIASQRTHNGCAIQLSPDGEKGVVGALCCWMAERT